MTTISFSAFSAWAPPALMLSATLVLSLFPLAPARAWKLFHSLSLLALLLALFTLIAGRDAAPWPGVVHLSTLGLVLALLVQALGTVIGAFSGRYLQGEQGQRQYAAALSAVLAAVHALLLADHWMVLIAAWASVGLALERLLCFYPDRPFARLAAHKKSIADRLADILLIGAATLAWREVGSGSLSDLWAHVAQQGASTSLQACALCLTLAVILRTALLPVHGWLIQVMEAPTPVSALLHAGVVNLGGFVLIRFAPLLEQATAARVVLLIVSAGTVLLAGLVMLTRISIKVKLAWSTVAQMAFMLLECAAGLYLFAALHLIGHSLYKAHAFLSASSVVREARLAALSSPVLPTAASMMLAPVLSMAMVLGLQSLSPYPAWPWWWSAILGLAWAPLLWRAGATGKVGLRSVLLGALGAAALIVAALVAHRLPLHVADFPHSAFGLVALLAMLALYACMGLMQLAPQAVAAWRRRSYAGFYLDEAYTRLALQLWPSNWTPSARRIGAELHTNNLATHGRRQG